MNRDIIGKVIVNYLKICTVSGGIIINYKLYNEMKSLKMTNKEILTMSLFVSPFSLYIGAFIGFTVGLGSIITLPLGVIIYIPSKIIDKINNKESVN